MFDFRALSGTEHIPGRDLNSFLEAVRFILAEHEPVGSHGDPIHYICFDQVIRQNTTIIMINKHN